MIVTRIKVPLEQAEYSALLKLSKEELRNPVDQVIVILRLHLMQRGLLDIEFQEGAKPAHFLIQSNNVAQDVRRVNSKDSGE